MKASYMGLLLVGLILMAGPVHAQPGSDEGRPVIGVRLDPRGLSDLLVKHLRLSPGQGIRIQNVVVDSPADKAGLERDDIIIQFEGRKVESHEQFVDAVREADVGSEVELEIIHLGDRKEVTVELESLSWDDVDWKYPPEPEVVESWTPGKLFHLPLDKDQWMEVPLEKFPDVNVDVHKFFKEVYTYQHADDSGGYSITIEGDPSREDTRVIVRKDDTEYNTTVKHIDDLPKMYREPARKALESATRSKNRRDRVTRFRLPSPPEPKVYRRYFKDLRVPSVGGSDKKDDVMERIEKQLDRLQERMEQLERRLGQIPERLADRDTDDSSDSSDSAGGEMEDEQAI